jgi:hypothetical protein
MRVSGRSVVARSLRPARSAHDRALRFARFDPAAFKE